MGLQNEEKTFYFKETCEASKSISRLFFLNLTLNEMQPVLQQQR